MWGSTVEGTVARLPHLLLPHTSPSNTSLASKALNNFCLFSLLWWTDCRIRPPTPTPCGFNFRTLSPFGLGSNALEKIHLPLKVQGSKRQSLLRCLFAEWPQLIQLSFQTPSHTHFALAEVQPHLSHIQRELRGFGGRRWWGEGGREKETFPRG